MINTFNNKYIVYKTIWMCMCVYIYIHIHIVLYKMYLLFITYTFFIFILIYGFLKTATLKMDLRESSKSQASISHFH